MLLIIFSMKKIIISIVFFSLLLIPFSSQLLAVGNDKIETTATTFTNPMPDVNSVNDLIGKVINAIMGFIGSLALLMFVFGGLTWMTSGGSQEKVKKGKDIVIWSALGLIVIFSAYAITNLIINYAVK